jgi:uncharacterized protein YacL
MSHHGHPGKDGLDAALDFTKYALAIAGAAIGFLLGSDILKDIGDNQQRWILTASLICFGSSAVGAILVLMQGASNLANSTYSLKDNAIRIPGLVNIFGLVGGFVFASLFVVNMIWAPPKQDVEPQSVSVQGTLTISGPAKAGK